MIRDMYYEKWGFMLIFWNLAGVPLSYCHCSLYLANHAPSVYEWNRFALVFFYASYLFVYWVWDTANSQKNRFRMMEKGTPPGREPFPRFHGVRSQIPRRSKPRLAIRYSWTGGVSYYQLRWHTSANFGKMAMLGSCTTLAIYTSPYHGASSQASRVPFPGSTLFSSLV